MMSHRSKNSSRNTFQGQLTWPWPEQMHGNLSRSVHYWSSLITCITAYVNNFNNILYLFVIAVHQFIADIKSRRWRGTESSQPRSPDRRHRKYSGAPTMILQDQVLSKEIKAWEKSLLKARLENFCRDVLKEADVCFRGEWGSTDRNIKCLLERRLLRRRRGDEGMCCFWQGWEGHSTTGDPAGRK